MAKTKVLFLCTGNSARSQMAEAYLRHYAGDQYEAHSAGLAPKGINTYTRQVMDEVGISLDGQESKNVDRYLGWVNFGWLITVCGHADANCPKTFLGVSHRQHWDDLEDPAAFTGSEAETLAKFRQVRDQIDQHVRDWLAEQQGVLG
ncbi:MAG: arsenate reductase ArsC [Chloroflexi bacterium]|nr:arsenate reductase ArsC [Ardenticatenaceae bacterium]MBL1129081.1 arsenate reductase ArsC [Chloroflexota bacterium]NOG35161.1 arsenate reductase ArsC [Chloroflexota bacterium]GIK54573.1 MAG: protein-tyrosine-phosphatase [Chloroflexota bacterium]